jgi:hypothetical protein
VSKSVHQKFKNSDGDSLPNVDVPKVAEDQDLRILGYLPDSQNLQGRDNDIDVSYSCFLADASKDIQRYSR